MKLCFNLHGLKEDTFENMRKTLSRGLRPKEAYTREIISGHMYIGSSHSLSMVLLVFLELYT